MDADDKDDADRYRAPALDKGLDILELLAEQKEGLTRAEITKLLGRNASEMYRMLERLVARQYVVRSAAGDRYSLSLKLYALAHRHPPMNRLISEALPLMQRFADAAEQSCHLVVYDRGNLLVIAQVDGPGTWGMSVRLGSRVGLIDTGSGRVMLAFQSIEQREQMLAEHTKVKGEVTIDRDALGTGVRADSRGGFFAEGQPADVRRDRLHVSDPGAVRPGDRGAHLPVSCGASTNTSRRRSKRPPRCCARRCRRCRCFARRPPERAIAGKLNADAAARRKMDARAHGLEWRPSQKSRRMGSLMRAHR